MVPWSVPSRAPFTQRGGRSREPPDSRPCRPSGGVYTAINEPEVAASVSDKTLTISVNGRSSSVVLPVRTSGFEYVIAPRQCIQIPTGYYVRCYNNSGSTGSKRVRLKSSISGDQPRPLIVTYSDDFDSNYYSTTISAENMGTICSDEHVRDWLNRFWTMDNVSSATATFGIHFYIAKVGQTLYNTSLLEGSSTGGLTATYDAESGWSVTSNSYSGRAAEVAYSSNISSNKTVPDGIYPLYVAFVGDSITSVVAGGSPSYAMPPSPNLNAANARLSYTTEGNSMIFKSIYNISGSYPTCSSVKLSVQDEDTGNTWVNRTISKDDGYQNEYFPNQVNLNDYVLNRIITPLYEVSLLDEDGNIIAAKNF